MKTVVDARGLACPEPVLRARKALAESDEVQVIVDNDTAVENIRRLAAHSGCTFSVTRTSGGWEIDLKRTAPAMRPEAGGPAEEAISCTPSPGKAGPLVVVLADSRMGRGDDTLGDVLIRAFVHTLAQLDPPPDRIVCYNAGVKLAAEGAPTLEDLQQLASGGADILVCGTCTNYFGLTGRIAAGRISNMYDILETMAGAGRLVRP
jgi:selenium metabolism protein YedF